SPGGRALSDRPGPRAGAGARPGCGGPAPYGRHLVLRRCAGGAVRLLPRHARADPSGRQRAVGAVGGRGDRGCHLAVPDAEEADPRAVPGHQGADGLALPVRGGAFGHVPPDAGAGAPGGTRSGHLSGYGTPSRRSPAAVAAAAITTTANGIRRHARTTPTSTPAGRAIPATSPASVNAVVTASAASSATAASGSTFRTGSGREIRSASATPASRSR